MKQERGDETVICYVHVCCGCCESFLMSWMLEVHVVGLVSLLACVCGIELLSHLSQPVPSPFVLHFSPFLPVLVGFNSFPTSLI